MNTYFLYEDREWLNVQRYSDAQNIIQDLGLKTLFSISAKEVIYKEDMVVGITQEDPFLSRTMQTVMMVPLSSEAEMKYRHEMLKDAFENKGFICELYSCVDDMLRKWDSLGRKVNEKGSTKDSNAKLLSDIHILKLFVTTLCTIKSMFQAELKQLHAKGFLAFYERLCEEFSEEKEAAFMKILEDVSFYSGDIETDGRDMMEANQRIILGCNIAQGLKCNDFVVEEIATNTKKFRGRNSIAGKVQEYLYAQKQGTISVRKNLYMQDEIDNLEYAVVRYVISACEPFVLGMNDFFDQLHFQLGFFRAAVNLHNHMMRFGLPYCYPVVGTREVLRFQNLKEFVMAVEQRISPVGNTCDISERMLLVITGANQGGKSTFLRSIGIAQVMMQCGLPVIAEGYESGIFPSFFTHFTRREDSAMNSGRLDEELKRMSQIIDNLGEASMVLLNESFATTTEKEGSIIAYDIIKALTEANVKVLTVTHLLSFAQRIYQESKESQNTNIEFFSAEREQNGRRTFRMIQHEPELTSFGMDLFHSIIGGNNGYRE